MIVLKRTGRLHAFFDIGIGCAFYAYGKIWIRTGRNEAGILLGTQEGISRFCNFEDDGTVKAKDGRLCEVVEGVELISEK